MSAPISVRTSLSTPFVPSDPKILPSGSRYLCFGPFHVDVKREELFKNGIRVGIPAKVYQVLMALLERPGEVVTREDLRRRLWPEGTFVNYDANVNTTVNKLRLALGDDAETPQFIETIPRQGYCFLGKVEPRDEVAKPQATDAVAVAPGSVVATAAKPAVPAKSHSLLERLAQRIPGFLMTGWAAAVLLCGVLLGMGIVLFTHRPS